jgi:hypothetical protein
VSKIVITATWEDAPHLTAAAKAELLASIPEYQRDARTKGIPQLGEGLIFTTPPADVTVSDFRIPAHWPRAYALDVGWNWTAAAWAAWNREADVVYLWSVYKRGQAEPSTHADAIKARGAWMKGVCDPAAAARSQIDGHKLLDLYRLSGLDLQPADHAVEAGLYEVWRRLSQGRLKVFESLREWFGEYGLYHRDSKGRVVKENDHLMDATRYLMLSGLQRAAVEKPVAETPPDYSYASSGSDSGLGWMA